jgi:hypothetical protein
MHFPAWFPVLGPILGRRRSYRELPELARRWGLKFTESDSRYLFGSFDGEYQGYAVQILPDTPSVSVKLKGQTESFMLMTLDTNQKPRRYDLGHPEFERAFRTMELGRNTAECLRGQAKLFDRILALRQHRVAGIMVSNQGLSCTMYKPYRRPRGSRIETANYIEAAELERILPEMIESVRLLESALASGGNPEWKKNPAPGKTVQ